MKPRICVIILHLKNVPCLADCLASLEKVTYGNFDVIIVNNGSDDLNGIDRNLKLKVRVLKSPSNTGFASGNNLGIKEAFKNRADYVLLLNDDIVVFPDFLDILVEAGENNPAAGMLGPRIYCFDPPHRIWFAGSKFDKRTGLLSFSHLGETDCAEKDSVPEESDFVTGCALLVKRALADDIGLLDERYFLYWEDVDWGLRARKAGFRNLVVPTAGILHKASFSTGGTDSPLKAYHKTRSHLLFADVHAPKTKKRLLAGFIRDIVWLLVKSPEADRFIKARAYFAAIADHYSGKTGSGPGWLWRKG